MNKKEHWENIYSTKTPAEVSWTQAYPETSIELVAQTLVSKNAPIIDIGGGDSLVVDFLLKLGYTDITVLDISAAAIERAKKRLGTDATKVEWLVTDILDFKPTKTYEVWHDRAVFHFLREQEEVNTYVDMVNQYAENIILATFSPSGPIKCSGLEITQYDQNQIEDTFGSDFSVENYFTADHVTPFNTVQNFSFARMKKKEYKLIFELNTLTNR